MLHRIRSIIYSYRGNPVCVLVAWFKEIQFIRCPCADKVPLSSRGVFCEVDVILTDDTILMLGLWEVPRQEGAGR